MTLSIILNTHSFSNKSINQAFNQCLSFNLIHQFIWNILRCSGIQTVVMKNKKKILIKELYLLEFRCLCLVYETKIIPYVSQLTPWYPSPVFYYYYLWLFLDYLIKIYLCFSLFIIHYSLSNAVIVLFNINDFRCLYSFPLNFFFPPISPFVVCCSLETTQFSFFCCYEKKCFSRNECSYFCLFGTTPGTVSLLLLTEFKVWL